MRKAARFVGIAWMALCAALWLYVGVFVAQPFAPDLWPGFTLPRLLADSRFGLTFLPILLAIPGAYLWAWGKGAPGQAEGR